MVSNIKWFILQLFFREDLTMLAMLWANQIILGKKTYKQVPAKLKNAVREILIDAGCEDLIEE
ncbi:MAG: hypothetical protein J6C92_02645 [Bacteroidaceae bacterium]|nr:hypothetical protein [Bacteroidaceae bacterium]